MGGKALGYEATRMSTKTMNEVARQVRKIVIGNLPQAFVGQPVPEPSKTSHGDVDLVIYCAQYSQQQLVPLLAQWLRSQTYKTNGTVTSFDFNGYQIDFLFTEDMETYLWKNYWYSWGHMSASIGKLLAPYDLKWCDDGLYFDNRHKRFTKKKDRLLITKKWSDALILVGYNNAATDFNWALWSNNAEMYQWICSSELIKKTALNEPNQRDTQQQKDFEQYLQYYLNTVWDDVQGTIRLSERANGPNDILYWMLRRANRRKLPVKRLLIKLILIKLIHDLRDRFIDPWAHPIAKRFKRWRWETFHKTR